LAVPIRVEEPSPRRPQRIHVPFSKAMRILAPFLYAKAAEQLKGVFPIVGYLVIFQLIVLRLPVINALLISIGMVGVILGLMLFMEGLRLGLMPFGETIGSTLPRRSSLPTIIGVAFLLGIGATLAEPAIGTLQAAGASINPMAAPLLAALLTRYAGLLVLSVGIGVGLAVILGVLRFLYGWSLKTLIVPLVLAVSGLSVWGHTIPDIRTVLGLAWDSGAVTTGPVTVPLVLALGLGVCRITGKSDTGMSGFGVVTLASLLPILSVLSLSFFLYFSGADLSVLPADPGSGGAWQAFFESVPVEATVLALRAILPLTLFLFLVQRIVLREKVEPADEIILGISLALIGMTLFNLGLSVGLIPLGDQVGGTVPAAFSTILVGSPPVPYGPLFGGIGGISMVLAFAFFLGYGATLAEPALNALGITVEEITVGAFRKGLLMQAVALGVGVGIMTGMMKLVFNVPLMYLLIPPYLILLVLTLISSEEFTNIGWDSAGVTTGPITVPLVIAMGLGVGGNLPNVVEGFGILSLASVFPVLSVLSLGLWVKRGSRI